MVNLKKQKKRFKKSSPNQVISFYRFLCLGSELKPRKEIRRNQCLMLPEFKLMKLKTRKAVSKHSLCRIQLVLWSLVPVSAPVQCCIPRNTAFPWSCEQSQNQQNGWTHTPAVRGAGGNIAGQQLMRGTVRIHLSVRVYIQTCVFKTLSPFFNCKFNIKSNLSQFIITRKSE